MDKDSVKFIIDAVCTVTSDSQTLAIAKWVTMTVPGRKRAAEFLEHYLAGSGTDKIIDVQELLRDAPELRKKIGDDIRAKRAAQPGTSSGKAPIPQSAYALSQSSQDWRYAIGSFVADWKVVGRNVHSRKLEVEVSFRNEYRWHPKLARISQCVHEAANNLKVRGARDYWMVGKPTRVEIDE